MLLFGWILAHDAVIERLSTCGLLESGGGMNPYTSALVRGMLDSGELDDNITNLRGAYSQRLEAMDAALKEHLPGAEYSTPKGGFFFWVKFPGIDAAELRQKANDFMVDFRQGALFSSQMGMGEYLRLGFCYYDPKDIEMGVRRLKECLG